ncbi:uncharacterized protein C6orf62 homolog isoform X3 [Chiloscyllium plagiosum]|uniref:uncharacterized protein C6orf62 homolog isoform X3 n=1 Tax=Chiloscyllium plagiosum TaxID=36176 RepID=UPI001CB86176|nr:uncharacterized protein C6orf62 homolog isoform X3 [Chiloscyllium plagiosum]
MTTGSNADFILILLFLYCIKAVSSIQLDVDLKFGDGICLSKWGLATANSDPEWGMLPFKDVIGCTQEMDFILWPRNDIEKMVCLLFSKWKGTDGEPFRPVQAKFEFHHGDYEKQFLHLLSRKDKAGLIINNPCQSIFLFIDRQHLQTPKTKAIIFKLCSVCLYLPQDQLTRWGVGTIEDHLRPYMPD